MACKTYEVAARLVHPSCYHSGYDFTVSAKNKAEAIKRARQLAWGQGHTRQDGSLRYTATEVE
jgi:hypothetical protein